ncbi:MAG: carbohydrate ABC transporter permease [Halodesulfurarchaeum sp.]
MATAQQHESRTRGFVDYLLEEYGSAQGLIFLLPTLALLTFVLFWPMFRYGLLLSFKNYTIGTGVNPWVGLDNYAYWIVGGGSTVLLFSIKQTIIYGLVVVPFDLVMALIAALVMNEELPARPLLRGLTLAGYAAPPVAAGITWAMMEHAASYGVVYQWLNMLPFISIPSAGGMTATTPWAFWAVILPKVWRDFGFMYVVLLAGVQSIHPSLYEMSKVDGASPIQRFRFITLPHLRTVIVTVVMIRMVFTVGKMAIPWAVTRGGPGNYTNFLGVQIFRSAFVNWNLGRAAALGMMFTAFLIPLILLWVRTETEDLG